MTNLMDRIAQANTLLAPYAVPHRAMSDRVAEESEDVTRFPFQRDRDRIIHSDAFRRLKGKTQVFVAHHGDHFRTRLTHTLEVAQISRDMARTLSLNEDLAECIALAHDLGHTPFGHAGEDALDECLRPLGKHFEHNEQSYRICTSLEERKPGVFGLNLNREVLDGLLKHATPHDEPRGGVPTLNHAPTLEAQIVNLADEIAYTAHDIDDGIRSDLFSQEEITPLLPPNIVAQLPSSSIRSLLIDHLVFGAYVQTEMLLQSNRITSFKAVLSAKKLLVDLPPVARSLLQTLRDFLWQRMYLHPSVREQSTKGQDVIRRLFAAYTQHPPEPVLRIMERTKAPLEIAVKDYIAGMTDLFALKRAAEL